MKTIKTFIIASIALIGFTQCTDDFINLQPVSEIGEGDFYKNEKEVANAVVACYNSLQEPLATEYLLTEFRSDNTIYNPTFSSGRQPSQYALDVFTLTSENIYVDAYYTAVYQSIAAANTVLKYSNVVESDEQRMHYEAEARFVRAYNYFNLVRLYGPVFLVTERISSDEANEMQRSPEDSVYHQIKEDLEFAVNHILDSTYTEDDLGRVTSWAAKSLLAKVYLTVGNNDNLLKAKYLLEEVMTGSGHALQANYADVFDDANEMNSEIIFSIRFKSNVGGLGNPLTTAFAPNNVKDIIVTGTGDGYNYPTTEIIETFKSVDTRKDANALTSYINDIGQEVSINYISKYISTQQTDDDSDADWSVLRYADVLLMYAEILNELEGPAAGLDYLNQVHVRAGLTPLTIAEVSTKHDFRLAIELERKLEFAFENQRWFDLVRTGRVFDVMENHFQVAVEYSSILGAIVPTEIYEWQLLLPIPQSQIDINPLFSQNFGY